MFKVAKSLKKFQQEATGSIHQCVRTKTSSQLKMDVRNVAVKNVKLHFFLQQQQQQQTMTSQFTIPLCVPGFRVLQVPLTVQRRRSKLVVLVQIWKRQKTPQAINELINLLIRSGLK